ncbi:MAG: flagellar basal body P-ring protein FlgI [Chitinivorax sp.]
MRFLTVIGLTLLASLAQAAPPSTDAGQRIKDLATVQGVRPNQLVGYGLVVGLDGTGDQATQAPFTPLSVQALLDRMGIQVPPGMSIQPKNVAAVTLTATLPAFAKPGQALDVTVASLGTAKSLRGGTLILSPLRGVDGQIYAMAQGNILVGGAGASGGGSSAQVNHLNAGRIPSGATVERAVLTPLGQGDYINLELTQSDFTTANRMVDVINRSLGADTARALDGRLVQVRAPRDSNERVTFLSKVENLAVQAAENSPRVIINARTGSVVMNQAVMLDSCAIAHGNLSVTVNATNSVSQPNAFSQGQTADVQNADVAIKADKGQLVQLNKGAKLADVVKALNSIGATPQDLLSILQAMKAAGALKAELEII